MGNSEGREVKGTTRMTVQLYHSRVEINLDKLQEMVLHREACLLQSFASEQSETTWTLSSSKDVS